MSIHGICIRGNQRDLGTRGNRHILDGCTQKWYFFCSWWFPRTKILPPSPIPTSIVETVDVLTGYLAPVEMVFYLALQKSHFTRKHWSQSSFFISWLKFSSEMIHCTNHKTSYTRSLWAFQSPTCHKPQWWQGQCHQSPPFWTVLRTKWSSKILLDELANISKCFDSENF